jgi:DNA-directed RNA polymerase specialized sigma subunit
MSTTGDKDIELWKKWKKTQTPTNLSPLLDQLGPLINKEVSRWSGAISSVPLTIEAKKLAVEALHSYDPKYGAALGTHVTNRLQKLSRLVYSSQNLAKLPELALLRINTLNSAKKELESRHGREPTIDELADHLSWSAKSIKKLNQFQHSENVESLGSLPISGNAEDDGNIVYIYHGLAPADQKLFEHLTGYGGAPRLNTKQLAKKLGMNVGQINYSKKKLTTKIQEMLAAGEPKK